MLCLIDKLHEEIEALRAEAFEARGNLLGDLRRNGQPVKRATFCAAPFVVELGPVLRSRMRNRRSLDCGPASR